MTSIPFYEWCHGQSCSAGALSLLLLLIHMEWELTGVNGKPFLTSPVALTAVFTAIVI
jgi:hypothetical protein